MALLLLIILFLPYYLHLIDISPYFCCFLLLHSYRQSHVSVMSFV